MTTNMGKFDRGGRLAIAAALLVLALGTSVLGAGILFWLALIVAGVFTLTAFVSNCPLYSIIGLKTCKAC
ncbi:YgaP family membrane protein [Primorskyibacter sp. S187A]|uniref:YgaP family membrane protein n=1 Tax=Primorskyibacter sp. S187A TaxID=3415130 RepID=UPI003C7D4F8C